MIYAIAAIDNQRGVANDAGIPWKLPADQQYFRQQTEGAAILMGFGMYQELKAPLPNRRNLVAIRPGTELRAGFEAVEDTGAFLAPYKDSTEIVWIVGGAKLYEKLLSYTQKLYLTRVQADFHCTKFFPAFEESFSLVQQSETQQENGLSFCYEVWDSQPVLKHNQVY
jgi:dihydrofolate reductase